MTTFLSHLTQDPSEFLRPSSDTSLGKPLGSEKSQPHRQEGSSLHLNLL